MFILAGLGNPGEEYTNTRHNAGRMMVQDFVKKNGGEWKTDKKLNALVSVVECEGEKIKCVLPETFMNRSGASLAPLVKGEKQAASLIVVYDDLDLALGSLKISFNRGSGGHRGLENIIKAVKTEAFVRIRVGISPQTPSGKLKKPSGEVAVEKAILGSFKEDELSELKKVSKKVAAAIEMLTSAGTSQKALAVARQKAMGEINS